MSVETKNKGVQPGEGIRFLHAADFHLDSAFGALSPEQGAQRRQEGRDLVMALAHYVNDHDIALVLLPGDLFENTNPYEETVRSVIKACETMNAQVCIAPGNHDYCGVNSPYVTQTWPDNVHIFRHNHLETLAFPQWNLTVSGGGFVRSDQTISMLAGHTMAQDGQIHMGLFHSELQGATPQYHPITQQEIENSGFHYLALGHIHKRCLPAKVGNTVVAWPGCLEGRGFDELGEKGFYTGTISPQGQVDVTFVPFARRVHHVLTVDVTNQDPLMAIQGKCPPETKPHLYRIVLQGTVSKEGVDMAALHQVLAPEFFYLELQDHTQVHQDLWEKVEEDSLQGLFLRKMQSALQQASDTQTHNIVELATRYGVAALEHQDLDGIH